MPAEATDYNKAVAEWEMFHQNCPPGTSPGRPFQPHPFPAMMFKAQRIPGSGKWAVFMPTPKFFGFKDENEWNRALEQAEQFRTSCQRVANDENERIKLLEEGYRDEPWQAVEFMLEKDKKIGNETAERNYRDRNMSEGAKAEIAAAEAAHFPHLPEVPEAPKKKRGRPAKNAVA